MGKAWRAGVGAGRAAGCRSVWNGPRFAGHLAGLFAAGLIGWVEALGRRVVWAALLVGLLLGVVDGLGVGRAAGQTTGPAAVTPPVVPAPPAGAGQSSPGAAGGAAGAAGAEAAAQPDARLVHPWDAMQLFLEATEEIGSARGEAQAEAYRKAYRAMDFDPAAQRPFKRQSVTQLREVLARIKQPELPDFFDFEEQESVSPGSQQRFRYFPNADLGVSLRLSRVADGTVEMSRNEVGEWRFSRETLEGLQRLYDSVEPLPRVTSGSAVPPPISMELRALMPRSLRGQTVGGVEGWQWLGLLGVIFVGLVVDLIVRTLLRLIWAWRDRRVSIERDRELVKRAVRPFGLLAAASMWMLADEVLGLPPVPSLIIGVAVRVLMVLASVLAAFRVIDVGGALLEGRASRSRTRVDNLLIPLVRKTLKTFVVAFGVVWVAESFQIEILPLLTGLGIGGLAFAFAAKDTIENFFGSIAVILDRPFDVGDWVRIGEVEGDVESLGLRSTRIRTFDQSLVTVPNATLVRATVDNFGRRRYRRYRTLISLKYGTNPERIEAFCEGVRELIRLHPYTRKDSYQVWLNGLGAHSLDVLMVVFFQVPDWSTELRERHRFILDVIRVAGVVGVEFAFPTQTIELLNGGEAPEPEGVEAPERWTEVRARRTGVEAAQAVTAGAGWRVSTPRPVTFAGVGLDGLKAREGSIGEDAAAQGGETRGPGS